MSGVELFAVGLVQVLFGRRDVRSRIVLRSFQILGGKLWRNLRWRWFGRRGFSGFRRRRTRSRRRGTFGRRGRWNRRSGFRRWLAVGLDRRRRRHGRRRGCGFHRRRRAYRRRRRAHDLLACTPRRSQDGGAQQHEKFGLFALRFPPHGCASIARRESAGSILTRQRQLDSKRRAVPHFRLKVYRTIQQLHSSKGAGKSDSAASRVSS